MKNPNGYGSVIKLSGNRRKPYAVRINIGFKDNGTPIYKYLSFFTSNREAKQYLAEYNRDPYDINQPTFNDIWELYRQDVLVNEARHTILNREVAYAHFEPLHFREFNKIKPIEVQNCIDQFESPRVQASMRRTFGKVEDYALKCELTTKNMARLLSNKPIPHNARKGFFTEEEINKLWENTDIPIVKDALILIYSGWRISEYCELSKDSIINGCMFGGRKTENGKNRYVPIHPRIMPFIEEKLVKNHSSALCGYSSTGQLRDRWKKCDLLNKHVVHEARHTFRTRLDNADANSVCIDLLMGHKSQRIGERVYTHKTFEQLKETVQLLP